jgi:hypothetical protein
MHKITLVGSVHRQNGHCNAEEASALLQLAGVQAE